jgi:hypothetical protein
MYSKRVNWPCLLYLPTSLSLTISSLCRGNTRSPIVASRWTQVIWQQKNCVILPYYCSMPSPRTSQSPITFIHQAPNCRSTTRMILPMLYYKIRGPCRVGLVAGWKSQRIKCKACHSQELLNLFTLLSCSRSSLCSAHAVDFALCAHCAYYAHCVHCVHVTHCGYCSHCAHCARCAN